VRKLNLLFLTIFSLLIVFFSPLGDKISSFFMLETIAGIDNLMTPNDSKLMGEKSSILTNTFKVITTDETS